MPKLGNVTETKTAGFSWVLCVPLRVSATEKTLRDGAGSAPRLLDSGPDHSVLGLDELGEVVDVQVTVGVIVLKNRSNGGQTPWGTEAIRPR